MVWYTPFQKVYETVRDNPFKTIGFATTLFCAYHVGKWERLREPVVEKIVFTADLNNDGVAPDCSIQLLNGKREAGYMQKNGKGFLTYAGMLRENEEREKILNGPSKSDNSNSSTTNPIDSPVDFRQYVPRQKQEQPASGPELNPYNLQQDNFPVSPERTALNSSESLEDIARQNLVPVIIPNK